MKKISQEVALDKRVNEYSEILENPENRYYEPKQLDLFKEDDNRPYKKKQLKDNPNLINLPEVSEQDIKYNTLSTKEIALLQKIIERSYKNYSDDKYDGIKDLVLINQNISKYPPEIQEQVKSENKKVLLSVYNEIRSLSNKFNTLHTEAFELSRMENPINLENISYKQFFLNYARFFEIDIAKLIGNGFGGTTNYTKIVNFLGKSSKNNIFNISTLDIIEKIEYLNEVKNMINATIADYTKKRRILINLKNVIDKEVKSFLRIENNILFLEWMDLNFPHNKKDIMDRLISDLKLSMYNSTSIDRFNFSHLDSFKYYKNIYDKIGNSIFNNFKEKSELSASQEIEFTLREIFQDLYYKEENKIKQYYLTLATDENTIDIFFKFVKRELNLDINSIINYISKQNENTNITNIKYYVFKSILNRFRLSNSYTEINMFKNFLSENKILFEDLHLNKIENLSIEDIKNFIKNKIKIQIIYNIDAGAGELNININPELSAIIAESGSLSVKSLANYLKIVGVPENFILGTAKYLFKNKSHYIKYFNKSTINIYTNILSKNNKLTVDSFINYLEYSLKIFIVLLNKITNESIISDNKMKEKLIINSIRSIDTLEKDKDNLSEFISFIHNQIKLPSNIILDITSNKNFYQFGKSGIVKKLIKSYGLIKGIGGLKNIFKKYGDVLKHLKDKNYISKNFSNNIKFITQFFESNQEINPSKDIFKQVFEITSSVETDLSTLSNSDALKDMLKDYKPKNKKLFDLDLQLAPNLRFRVLKDKDPSILRIGIETDCCQRIGGAGEVSARDSFINPLASVVVLEWFNDDKWKILSQSYFHYVPKDNSYILDNVEYNKKNVGDSGLNLDFIYGLYASKVKEKLNVKYFLAGKDYSKIDSGYFKSKKLKSDPRFFDQRSLIDGGGNFYTDFDHKNSIDLLNPVFNINKDLEEKIYKQLNKEAKNILSLIKLSNKFTSMIRNIK